MSPVYLFSGETVRFHVRWTGAGASPPFFVHTNLPLEVKEAAIWHDIPMTQCETPGHWELAIPAAKQGRFLAQVRYQEEEGCFRFDTQGYVHVAVNPASMSDVRLYSLIPRASGHLEDWIAKLPEIRDLGFNTLHILPVTAMDASSSPYSAASLFKLDPRYLPPDAEGDGLPEWRRFVDALKEHGLRLCVDLVLNHVGITSELALERPEFFVHDAGRPDGLKRAGAVDGDHWIIWEDLALLNFEHPEPAVREELWATMTAYAKFWTSFAHETGGFIRLDNLHSTSEPFLNHVMSALRQEWPDLPVFGELFTTEENVRRLSWKYGLSLCLATPWGAPYAYQVRDQLRYIHQQKSNRYLFPLASHDSGSPAQEYGGVEAVIPRYVSAALFSTGQTGAVQGNEDGITEKIPFIGVPERLNWKKNAALRERFRQVNQLHASSAAFRKAGNLLFVDGNHGAVLAAVRWHEDDVYLLLTNLDPRGTHTVRIPRADIRPATAVESETATLTLTLTDCLGTGGLEWTEEIREFILPPTSAHVYRVRWS